MRRSLKKVASREIKIGSWRFLVVDLVEVLGFLDWGFMVFLRRRVKGNGTVNLGRVGLPCQHVVSFLDMSACRFCHISILFFFFSFFFSDRHISI